MPLPHYIIGSMFRSEDKATGLVSFIQVIEKLAVTAIADISPEFAKLSESRDMLPNILISASWMRTPEEDTSTLFDSEWWISMPGEPLPKLAHEHKIQIEELFGRVILNLILGKPKSSSGVACVENRLRVSGSERAWQTQRFNFWLDYQIIAPESSEPKEES